METQKNRRRYFKYIAIILAALCVVSAALCVLNIWEKKQGIFSNTDDNIFEEEIVYNGEKYILKDNVDTFLVLGLDKFENTESGSYNNDKQADFLMLFVIDNKKSACTAIHINRDTMAEINVLGVAGNKVSTTEKQIALAHTYGNGKEVSCRNTAKAVSKLLLDVKIDHYMSVTMEAVPKFNDLVGGVALEVLEDFSGIDDTLVKGKTVTLKGEHALNYVRTRYGLEDPTNNTRMVRQRQYLKALYDKTRECIREDDGFISKASLNMKDHIVSDCSANKLETLFTKMQKYELEGIYDIKGKTVKGEKFMEFYPDTDSITDIVIKAFYDKKD